MQRLSQAFKRYLHWWVIVLFVFIPLYPKLPLMNVPGTYVAIRAEDFLIAFVCLWWFVSILPDIRNLLKKTAPQIMILFWGIGALSLFSAIFITQTVTLHLGLLHYLRRIEVMILFLAAWTAFSSLKQVKLLAAIMLFTTLAIILYGFGQQWLSFPVISTTNREFSKGLILFLTPDARVNSTFAGHYDLAAFLVLFLVIAFVMLLTLKSIWIRILVILVSLLGFILLTMTAARVSFAAAILGLIGAIWLLGQKRWILLIVILSILAFSFSPELRNRTIATITVNFLEVSGPTYSPPPQKSSPTSGFSIENAATDSATPSGVPVDIAPGEPLNTTELGVYRSFGIRFNEEWPRAIRAFLKNPFLGTGYSSLTIATDNDYLRSLGETGLLGTLALGLLLIFIFRRMWQFINQEEGSFSRYLVIGIFSGCLALLVNATFIDILESSKIASIFWLTLGVAFALIDLSEDYEKN